MSDFFDAQGRIRFPQKEKPGKKLKVLDFDIENRPLSYLGNDFTTADITTIAAGWANETVIYCRQGRGVREQFEMLIWFAGLYQAADMVTGHYILRHDLPLINGALIEAGVPGLGPKLVSDTKVHLRNFKGISKSQENLADMFGLPAPKVHMTTPMWREANRLTDEGLELAKKRCAGDVRQHKQLRKELLKRGMLGPPHEWRP